MSQLGSGAGNTKNQRLRSRGYTFTYNNPCEVSQFIDILETSEPSRYCFQLEQGSEGTKHFQGWIYYSNQREFSSMKQLCKQVHWEKMKSLKASMKYCTKPETRIGGPWFKGISPPREIKLITPRDWQCELESELQSEPNDRTIIWYSDPKGGIGKTSLAKYLVVKYNALYVSGKATDVKFAVSNLINKGKSPNIIIYAVPRTYETFVSYDVLESMKDGIFFSSKYESGMCVFPTPHVVVFANFLPKIENLSIDRWDIRELSSYGVMLNSDDEIEI